MYYFKQLKENPVLYSFLQLNFGSLISKMLGFFRLPLVPYFLGVIGSDRLISADKIGQFLVLFLITGTLYNAIVPVLVNLKNEKPEYISTFFTMCFSLTTFLIVILCSLSWIFTSQIVELVVDSETLAGMNSPDYLKFIFTVRILLLTPIILVIQSFFSAFLSLDDKFTSVSVAGIFSNIFVLLALYFSDGNYTNVAYGIVLGILVGTLGIVAETFYRGFRFDFDLKNWKKNWVYFLRFVSKSLPRTLIISPVNVVLLMIIPLKQFDGQIYSFDLLISVILAFGFISMSYTTVIFTRLTEYLQTPSSKNTLSLGKLLRNFVKISFIQLVASILGSYVILYLMGIIFNISGTYSYIYVLILWSIPYIFLSPYIELIQRIYFAFEDNALVYFNILFNLILVFSAFILVKYTSYDSGIVLLTNLFVFNFLFVLSSLLYFRKRHELDFTKILKVVR